MAINGKDLIELGIDPGARLGSIKKQLLNEIIDGVIPNDREALLARAQVLFKNCQ